MLMKAAPEFGGAARGTISLLPPHVLGWAGRMFAVYLGAAVAAMVAGTGVLYVGHLVQPSDQWPDYRPAAHGQPASHAQAVPGAVFKPIPSDAPAIPVAAMGKTEAFPLRLAEAHADGNGSDSPGQRVDERDVRRTRLLAAMRAAGLAKAGGASGPFTMFVPSDDGLDRLIADAARRKLPADARADLRQQLTGHVVAGDFSAERLRGWLKQPGAHLSLQTLNGNMLMVTALNADSILVRDGSGRVVAMVAANGQPKDGIHVFDQVGATTEDQAGSR